MYFHSSDEFGIAALAIVYPDEEASKLFINELFADTPEAERLLLTRICQDMQAESLDIIMPPVKDHQLSIGHDTYHSSQTRTATLCSRTS